MNKRLLVLLLSGFMVLTGSIVSRAGNGSSSIMEQFASTSPIVLASLLNKGQLIFIDNTKPGKPQFITAITLFNTPIGEVFSTITDYNHYVGHIPDTTDVKIVQKNGNIWLVSYKIEFKFSIISEHANYTLKQVLYPPKSITWTRIKGNLDKLEGSWHLVSVENGKKTIGFYRVYTDISSLGFLVRLLLEKQPLLNTAIATSSALVYVKAMRKWVDSKNRKIKASVK